MKKKKCWDCGAVTHEVTGEDPNGFIYSHWKCTKCSREVLDMEQLHGLSEQYRRFRKMQKAKVSKWGTALAVRIPKEIVISQKIKPGEIVRIQEEKIGFRIIPEK